MSSGAGSVELTSRSAGERTESRGARGEAPRVRTVRATLVDLSDHSKGRRAAARARRVFIRDVQISVTVAFWVVCLATPVIVWPIGEKLWEMGCVGLDYDACSALAYCNWISSSYFVIWTGTCETAKRGFLSLWGAMILQFVFQVYRDLGSSVKFTMQGAFGTLLAWANITFLNAGLAFILGGGAHRSPLVPSGAGGDAEGLPVNSRWLPLCADGFRKLTGDMEATCFMNIWVEQASTSGVCRVIVVALDFVLFLVFCLHVGFDANTRMFALSAHVYFVMAFLNPSADDFDGFPTTADIYLLMIFAASLASVGCFFVPRKRFTAAEAAEELAEEAAEAVGLLLESLHCAPAQLMRQKAASTLAETKVALSELEETLGAVWFEDFGVGAGARRRKALKRLASALRGCLQHVPAVYNAAAALTLEDAQALEERLCPLQGMCAAARDLAQDLPQHCLHAEGADEYSAGQRPTASLETCHARLAEAFERAQGELSGEACAFILAVVGVAADVSGAAVESRRAISELALRRNHLCPRAAELAGLVAKHFGLNTADREATHPRFVARHTLSISIAFWIGWLGLWNVLPAYSSYPSNTICVIFYTYAGSSAPMTIKRVAGVVIGKVIGTVVHLGIAVKSVVGASQYAVSMWVVVACMFFMYLHSGKEMQYVCCLAVALAAGSMIPRNCIMRTPGTSNYSDVVPGLMASIVSTVIGVAILVLVDLLFASKATNQARQRLLRAVRRAARLVASVSISRDAGKVYCRHRIALLMEDVSALHEVLPFAAAEPMYWRPPFKVELYEALECGLRALAEHVDALCWAASSCGAELASGGAPPDGAATAQADLGAVLRRLEAEVLDMFESITELSASVTEKGRDTGAEEVRRQLEDSLYTVKAMSFIASGVSRPMALVKRRTTAHVLASSKPLPSDSSSELSATGARVGGLKGKVTDLYKQIVHEELRGDAGGEDYVTSSTFTGAQGGTLAELVGRLREGAALRRSPVPALDGPCRVELVALCANSVLLEAQRMQLALLEH